MADWGRDEMSTVYWTGGASAGAPESGTFRNPNDWSTRQTPGADDDVILGGQGYSVTLARGGQQLEQVNSMEIDLGAKLRVIDPQAASDANGQTTLSIQSLDDKGAIVLGGGLINGYSGVIEQGASISGWGSMNMGFLDIYGTINATGGGDGVLHLTGASVYGKLTGSGEIDLDTDTTIYSNNVSVAKLASSSTHFATDVDLSKTYFESFYSDDLQGHTITLGNSVLVNHTFNSIGAVNGLVHNLGNMDDAGSYFFCQVQNDGNIEVEGDNVEDLYLSQIAGKVSGHGTISVDPYAMLIFDDVVKSGQTIELHGGSTIDYEGSRPAAFQALVSGFDSTDQFDFSEIANDQGGVSLKYTAGDGGGTLVLHADHQVASIHLVGNYVASGFQTSSDGQHGTLITYHDPSQDMAAAGSVLHI
jgi:hypothetical protein